MSDWDEIRRLAADLQRAQLSGSVQKLSERNCIEIVTRLIQTGLIDVVYTTDGKEYLTPQQIQREIKDELYVARGRVGLVELAQMLSLDFSHIETQAQLIAKQDGRVNLVLGQLVNADYLDSICDEINENLQLHGSVSISKLTKDFDLPSEFLQEEINKRIGSVIEGFKDEHDPKTILTSSYVSRSRAKIRGALSAATVPTSVASIINKFQIPEQLFFSLAEQLIKTNRIAGTISGGRKAAKATFTPHVYSVAQTHWVDNFMNQNGYLEYDSLTRLGISDPKSFIKKRFDNGGTEVHFLPTCCVGSAVFNAIDSAVDDAVHNSMWLDVGPLLPSVLSQEDGNIILKRVLERREKKEKQFTIFANTVLVSPDLLSKVEASFDDLMQEQAKKDTASRKYEKLFSGKEDKLDLEGEKLDKKEERRKKAAAGKGGGGTQGRETKTKSTKKKYGKNKKDDWDDSDDDDHVEVASSKGKRKETTVQRIEYLTKHDLEEKISRISLLQECPEELFGELADILYPRLTKKFKDMVTDLYQSSVSASIQGKKKSHGELQEKCNAALSQIRLFEKGVTIFDGNERKNLEKHLLKTLCTDLTNSLFAFVHEATEVGASLNPDQRMKILADLPKDEATALLAIHKSLNGDDVASFQETFEEQASKACDVFIRKPDKKKDRQLVFNHRLSLIEQLNTCEESALLLHLVVMLLFQGLFNVMVHASGKFVPQILQKILPKLEEDEGELLKQYQTLVMDSVNSSTEDKEKELREQLKALEPKLKEIGLKNRKAKTEE